MTSSLQMAFPDSEPTIAGKTHSEILVMTRMQRHRWYRTISPKDRAEAMRTVETVRRAKSSVAMTGRVFSKEHKAKLSVSATGRILSEATKAKLRVASTGRIYTEETCAKISASKIGKPRSEETKAKISMALTGENHPMYGKTLSEEHKAKQSAAWTPEMRTRQSVIHTGENNVMKQSEVRAKHKEAIMKGEGHPNWRGGISFEPYCRYFNGQLKESIRNRDNRTCVLCGKSEIQNGRRLSVHHIDGDKRQGCGKRWYLCALCISCNSRPDTVEKEFLIVTNQNQIGGRK